MLFLLSINKKEKSIKVRYDSLSCVMLNFLLLVSTKTVSFVSWESQKLSGFPRDLSLSELKSNTTNIKRNYVQRLGQWYCYVARV